jgi:hypothetical protein
MKLIRRSLLLAGASAALPGLLQGCGGSANADTAVPPPYPQVADVSAATPELASFMTSFFTAKSLHQVDQTMAHFSPELVSYMDATLGLNNAGFSILEGAFSRGMPKWPATGLSYHTRVLGDMNSALVAFTDTPELFGGEIRAIGTLDFKNSKIVRWVDHWDGRGWANSFGYPKVPLLDYKEAQVGEKAAAALTRAATALQQAMSTNDASAASALYSPDSIYEDMALRLQIQGRDNIKKYFTRALPTLPNGVGAAHRHTVGSAQGGGYEWKGQAANPVQRGVTVLVLDQSGRITRSTAAYDSALFSNLQLQDLVKLSFD